MGVRWTGVALSVVLVVVAVLLAGEGGGGPEAAPGAGPRPVSAGDLRSLERELGHAVYWAGERPPQRLGLTRRGGDVYVAYLPPGTAAARSELLTVGTYPVADAVAALRRSAAGAGVGTSRLADGAVVFVDPARAGSAYFARPGSNLQVEVYDPRPGRALRLVRSGAVRPLG